MKKEKIHPVVENLVKIMQDRGLTKVLFAELIGFPEPKWNKISNGNQHLSICELSNIAEALGMREIDIYSYPVVYDNPNAKQKTHRVTLQIDIEEEDIKEDIIKLSFGERVLEIKNK